MSGGGGCEWVFHWTVEACGNEIMVHALSPRINSNANIIDTIRYEVMHV